MTRLMNGVPSSCAQSCRRGEDHDVAALVGVEARRQLVDQHVLIGLQRVLHRLLLDLVRLGDEVLDDEEDDEGEDEGLDDLEETPEHGSSGHKTGSIGAGPPGAAGDRVRSAVHTARRRAEFDPASRRLDTLAAGLQGPTPRRMPMGPEPALPGRPHRERRTRARPGRIAVSAHVEEDPTALMDASTLQLIILPAGIIAVLFAIYLARDVLSRDTGHAGDAGRRRHDLRGRGRLHPAPVHDDRASSPSSAPSSSAIVIALVETADVADVPKLAGAPIGIRTGDRLPRRRRLLDGVGDHRHVHQRQGQRPDRLGGPAQPRRGGPGRDARRRRLRASSSSPCRCSACGASSPCSAASSAA